MNFLTTGWNSGTILHPLSSITPSRGSSSEMLSDSNLTGRSDPTVAPLAVYSLWTSCKEIISYSDHQYEQHNVLNESVNIPWHVLPGFWWSQSESLSHPHSFSGSRPWQGTLCCLLPVCVLTVTCWSLNSRHNLNEEKKVFTLIMTIGGCGQTKLLLALLPMASNTKSGSGQIQNTLKYSTQAN